MAELLAPNGKPSNLTPEQYDLVRTPEFKAWFGDWEKLILTKINDSGIDEISLKRLQDGVSKVVDVNGEPLVVYHGTNAEFWKFEKSKGKGNIKQKSINFSSNKEVAKNYGNRIITCFLNLKNPLIKNYNGENYHTITFDARFENRIKDIPDVIVNQTQSEKKYDGVIFFNIQDSKSAYDKFSVPIANNYYAFNNKQIKLADGTNTTFDGSNPDIRFDGGGEISFNNNRVFFNGEDIGLFEYGINGNEIEINRLYLDNTKQKQGFGRDIIKNLFESYPNVDKIVLYPLPSSEPFWIRITENVRKDGYFEITRNSFEIGNKKYFRFKKGGRTIAQTPAPKKERIYGSEKNKPESSKDTKSAEKIEFNEKTLETIKNKVAEHNEKNPKKKVTLASAKAVVRRGMGAYSSSHRPTIKGGKPNSRVAWGLARLNAFFYKIINGKSKSGKYNQDDDLINELGYKVKKYANGGDIQAYEEAMDISEYADGGETKPKKVYVSIRLDNELEKIPNTFSEYFTNYSEKPFQELKNGKLFGLVGVSTSPNNIAEWFIHRDCLIVMNYDEFMAINETETINYYDPYQLMKNNLYLFRRLYANVTRYGEQNDSVNQTIKKICERILPEINLEMNVSQGQKYSELYRILKFLSPYETGAFPRWIEDNKMKIESPIDLTNAILDFNKLYDSYLGSGYENPVLTFDELLPLVEKGITNASKIYESEQEIVLTNRELNIPKKSQLFFIAKDEVGQNRQSNRDELIQKYNLKQLYKVYFVDRQELQKYRGFWLKKEEEKFKVNIEKGREDLELKKQQILDELLNYFLEKSISYIKNELEKEIIEYNESLDFYDETDDDYIEQNLFSIPLVQSIMNTYELIIKNFWKSFIEKKQVKNLDINAFWMFYFNAESELKRYFENNKDELEKLSNYRNTRGGGGSLYPYIFERLILQTINDYEKIPELVDYKKLAKMYLDKMGREIYRYYDKNELKLVSQYKEGGETDEPTNFWGTEAGGVLIYCSTTVRYLILLRSGWVTEPNSWGMVSGKLDEDEDEIQKAVYREAEEEIGYKLRNLIPTYIFEKENFKFHNFVSIVDKEFVPELNWENTDYKWVKLNELPQNLHFGLKKLLENEDIPKLVKKHRMENEILVIDMNMYRYDTSVNFKNKEIPLKLNPPMNQVKFIEWAEDNNFEFEQWGDAGMDDVSWGYTFEIPLNNYIDYLKTENLYTGGELKKGIKTEMEHKDTIKKIKTGDYTIKQSAEMIAKDHLEENDKYYTHLTEMEKQFEDGGRVESIHSSKGDIKLSLDENWYSDDTDVELVPVSELIKFREFDRKKKPKYNLENSKDNINHLKFMFQKEGVKSPLIIEYSPSDNAVLIIEGNHRLNSAIDLGMEYLPARVVLKKYGNYSPEKLKNTMQVSGVVADESGYIPSNLKPSQVGIQGAKPVVYAEGGIIEGRLHSECGDDGCGRKFQVGEGGHIIEAERDEAVIVADTFKDNEEYTIKGTPSEIASALNVMGGGKNFNKGAIIVKNGEKVEIPQLNKEAQDTDVDDIIDPNSIIINRRSMADEQTYEVTGTPKQIASAINSVDGNGVVIQEGATIKKT